MGGVRRLKIYRGVSGGDLTGMLQRSGYESDTLASDASIGLFDGIDSAVWSYTYATIIFSGALSIFLPIGLAIVLGSRALASLFVVATSRVPVHTITNNEQGVIILGAIGALLVAHLQGDVASPTALSTMLAVTGLSGVLVVLSLFLVARLRLSHILEMIPYPVVCGFMVGVMWLFLNAGISIATDTPMGSGLLEAIMQDDNMLKLLACVAGGALLVFVTNRFDSSLAMPVTVLAIVCIFYAVIWFADIPLDTLVPLGWLFNIDPEISGMDKLVGMLSFSSIDVSFILSVTPQIATIVFLVTMAAAMEISILGATNHTRRVRTNDELLNNSGANIFCAALCGPPTHTDGITSQIYKEIGAASRWTPIVSGLVLLAVVPFGTKLITYTPVVLLGSAIFMFAFQMFYDWMIVSMRRMTWEDRAIVLIILATVIGLGFVEGVLAGLLVTAALFVLRYSFISAIHSSYGLNDYRSSVERSNNCNGILQHHGQDAHVVRLRGYLFFGTSNAIREKLTDTIARQGSAAVLLDLKWVTGIDGSAMQVFHQIKQLCDSHGVELLFSGTTPETRTRLIALDAVSNHGDVPLIFDSLDFAVEWMEDLVLSKHADEVKGTEVDEYLEDILADPIKAVLVKSLLERIDIETDEVLFRQGDPDGGLYILESGTLTATIDNGNNSAIRVKKFSAGSLIGELSGYAADKKRTATITADTPSVLYHLDIDRVMEDTHETGEAMSAVHEMVARTLSGRLDYMNRRLMREFA